MSEANRVEIQPDETPNPSLEEQAKLQDETIANTNTATSTEEVKVEAEPRPEWLPEKFENAEALAKAYSALEQKLSQNEPSQQEANKLAEQNQQAENTLEPFYQEYADKGELSEKSYADLQKLGLDKNIVDGYIAGQKAIADNEVKMIHDTVGGEENYNKMVEWSKTNLSDSELEAFNSTLDNGSIDQVRFAVQAIASRAGISGEAKSEMIQGETEIIPDAFESIAQVTEAMNDPRYEKDPAYRASVEKKIARSSVI
jgi:hypothetical protein